MKERRSYTGAFLKPVLARRGVERKRRTEAAEYDQKQPTCAQHEVELVGRHGDPPFAALPS